MILLRTAKHSSAASRTVLFGRPLQPSGLTRNLHATSIVQKTKKASKAAEDDDAFGSEEDGDLFAISEDTRPTTKVTSPSSQASKIASKNAALFQSAKEQLLRNPQYAAYYYWREQKSGKASDSPIADTTVLQKHAKAKDPPRRAILANMIAHASTRAELLEIVDVFSIYREQKWRVDELNRVDFIGRCISLKSPDIALAILYYRPQFAIDLPSLSTGRALLHSLLWTPYPPADTPLPEHLALPTSTPFTNALLLANLFDVYALPPVESDQVTRALLLGACANPQYRDAKADDVEAIKQKIRDWVEAEKPGGTEKLFRSVKAVKETGTSSSAIKTVPVASARTIPPEHAPFYNRELTVPEKSWIKGGLENFVKWAQGKGEDVAWVEKLMPQMG
ncbi:hypothetical protein RhiJN_10090 [Ceratobasidium sp. AG-Ba]|nr:hypothetical protein RhiJN_10090 [Ceratobasidium sp. AG-Ba]QRW10850.1 hypothetical protein RhiLY_09849 [Ceratobasidium sp. AG-Ba]